MLEMQMVTIVFVFSLALLIGLFALPGSVMISYGASNSSDQKQVTVPESNQEQVTAPKAKGQATAKTHRKAASHHRHYRNDRDYDRDYDRPYTSYHRGYYDPYYYNDYYYPRSYNYGPGLSVDTPFFGIRIP